MLHPKSWLFVSWEDAYHLHFLIKRCKRKCNAWCHLVNKKLASQLLLKCAKMAYYLLALSHKNARGNAMLDTIWTMMIKAAITAVGLLLSVQKNLVFLRPGENFSHFFANFGWLYSFFRAVCARQLYRLSQKMCNSSSGSEYNMKWAWKPSTKIPGATLGGLPLALPLLLFRKRAIFYAHKATPKANRTFYCRDS